ncbi:unnamed protein product, partial [Ectocarpus fasciculatus]
RCRARRAGTAWRGRVGGGIRWLPPCQGAVSLRCRYLEICMAQAFQANQPLYYIRVREDFKPIRVYLHTTAGGPLRSQSHLSLLSPFWRRTGSLKETCRIHICFGLPLLVDGEWDHHLHKTLTGNAPVYHRCLNSVSAPSDIICQHCTSFKDHDIIRRRSVFAPLGNAQPNVPSCWCHLLWACDMHRFQLPSCKVDWR